MVKTNLEQPQYFGRYKVVYELAAGGMGSVYVAKDPVLSRLVAIKVLHPQYKAKSRLLERFFQEAQIVAQLKSPNIVEVYDFGPSDRDPYLVMEYVDGLSLWSVLESLYPEPMDQVVTAALICQAAEGLAAAAQRDVVHRDIKPENLLISPQGYLKIADFGISHVKNHSMTRTGSVVGSPSYMSPEQAEGEKGITYQSDMFSLGVVFYSCLCGMQPFQAESVTGLIKKIVSEPHPPIHTLRQSVDPELIQLVETLLQKDPKLRGQGPKWLKGRLKEYLLKKKVADPVERIKEYLTELSGRGIQTTGFVNPLIIATAMAMNNDTPKRTPLEIPPLKGSHRRLVATIFGILVLAVGVWVGVTASLPASRPAAAEKNPARPPETQPLLNPAPPPTIAQERVPAAPVPVTERPSARLKKVPKKVESHAGVSTPKPASAEDGPAYFSILSSPPFAEVSIDGFPVGTTPIEKMLPAGHHQIHLEKLSATFDTTMDVSPGPHNLKFKIPGALER